MLLLLTTKGDIEVTEKDQLTGQRAASSYAIFASTAVGFYHADKRF